LKIKTDSKAKNQQKPIATQNVKTAHNVISAGQRFKILIALLHAKLLNEF